MYWGMKPGAGAWGEEEEKEGGGAEYWRGE